MYNTDFPTRAELPSSQQLLRSTIIAIIIAVVLLVTVVLPSEYGIDPIGIGRVLGLTQMGEIKRTLATEAQSDNAANASQRASVQTGNTSPQPPAQATQNVATQPAQTATETKPDVKTDEMSVTLKPGEGNEVKLEMSKGEKATYEWSTAGGAVNHDLHGEGANNAFISYKKGTQSERDAGELTAAFDGSHGWFWRNRTGGDVTVTVKTTGEYRSIKRMK